MFWHLLKKCQWYFARNAYLGGECDDNMFQVVQSAYLFWVPRESNAKEKEESGEFKKALGAIDDTL